MHFSSVQSSRSVVSDSLHPVDYSTPGLPVHHKLPEFTQAHVHLVGDAIQPSLFWGTPKSLQMLTASMKLKDACSFEEQP